MDFLKTLVARFSEPSSWVSLAGGIGMMGLPLPTTVVQLISYAGAAIALAVGFFLSEKTPTTPAQ